MTSHFIEKKRQAASVELNIEFAYKNSIISKSNEIKKIFCKTN